MLELKNISKQYRTGDEVQTTLDQVSLTFSNREFVSILGASGSGKTTLLNIIGGLDTYDGGDLLVNGTSTQSFKKQDWDAYRNRTIGFVFQSYNLISHLSILENVKMALSIAGVPDAEGKERALGALKDVGLEKHVHKKPSQLSGGQMQRVAIARALVTNPQIILADEPTGALDSKTSVQIMELMKKISKDKLVIMVTHNPELAELYSNRIIRIADGKVTEDIRLQEGEAVVDEAGYRPVKTSMSLGQAVSSSFKNLLTKKIRTGLTVLAASIGIISIASVLSISAGMDSYIEQTQKDSLSTMPITVSATAASSGERNLSDRFSGTESAEKTDTIKLAEDAVAHSNHFTEDALGNGGNFMTYMEEHASGYYDSLSFDTGYNLKALVKNQSGEPVFIQQETGRQVSSNFAVLPEDMTSLSEQYDLLAGEDLANLASNQVVLFIPENGTLTAQQLEVLGYADATEVEASDLIGKEISVLTNDDYYQEINNHFLPKEASEELYQAGQKLTIATVVRAKDANSSTFSALMGYSTDFLNQMLEKEKTSTLVQKQAASPSKSLVGMTGETLSQQAYTSLMQGIGGDTSPTSLKFYTSTVEEREQLVATIEDFNQAVADKYGKDSEKYAYYEIEFVDMSEMLTSVLGSIITVITFILTAFSGISLLVSSVMIGILTYVSVVERTKEIGIMRAIGARQKDISRIFNAEAGLIGLTSGLLGVGIAMGLNLVVNGLIESTLNITGFTASLSPWAMVALVALSLLLTLIAGYIPSRIAAKKNPVEALRSE
ncbi:TPA: ATP-binding cassette domain-containing protein [Streptococcus suis]